MNVLMDHFVSIDYASEATLTPRLCGLIQMRTGASDCLIYKD